MAALTLYNHNVSPPCRLVRLVAGIIGVDLKVINIKDFEKDLQTPEMLKKNPQHTVPILKDNELCIAESRAIAMYLVSKYAKDDSLYPKDLNRRVLVDQRLFFDQDLYNKILSVYLPNFAGKKLDSSYIERVTDGLETLNRMLDGKQWLAGDRITLADHAVAISLSALEEFVPEAGIDPMKQPNIKTWLPRVQSSSTKHVETLKEFREAIEEWHRSEST